MHDFEKTKFITGLRAYSSLAVVLIHYRFGIPNFSGFVNKVVGFGRFGVVSFFVLSAFTICMSVDRTEVFNFKEYLLKRFLRIAPLYYFILLLCFFFTSGNDDLFHYHQNLYSLFMHVSFLNLFDSRCINNMVGVEGTVPIEFAYYLIIPYIFFLFKKKLKTIFPILIAALLFSLYSFQIFKSFYNKIAPELSHHLSLEKYLFIFVLGIAAYSIWRLKKQFNFGSWALLMHFVLLAFIIQQNDQDSEVYIALWIVGLIFICSGKSRFSKIIFENRYIEYLGKISYSIYLVHFPVMSLLPHFGRTVLNFIVPLAITLIISSITYKFIELPFLQLAHNKRKMKKLV
jgi:peptidoglycan/LPS O-acetylase OafA/YrhL